MNDKETIDTVSIEVYKQVAWERDIAIEQLRELGYSLGEKIRYEGGPGRMKVNEAIRIIKRNRDANSGKPKFQEACNMAITALKENRPLKQRCMALSGATLCAFCRMKCPDLGDEE